MPAPKDPEKRRIWKELIRKKALDQWQRPGMRETLSQAHKGQHSSPGTQFKPGMKPWNTGLTKETDERLANANFHVTDEHKAILKEKQTGETNSNWVGGSYQYWHEKAWKLFGKGICEHPDCLITNQQHLEIYGVRLHMHCNSDPKDYTILEDSNWYCCCIPHHNEKEK